MVTIAIANRKGGVGKTTTAVTIATWLATHGRRVVVVDLDAQAHVAASLGLEPANSVFNVLVNKADVLKEMVAWRGSSNLGVLRSNGSTADAKAVLVSRGLSPAKALSPIFGPLRWTQADYVLIDSAPGEDVASMAILYNADYVLAPTLCEYLSLDGLRQLAQSITEMQTDYDAKISLLGVVPQMFDAHTREHAENLALLAETFGRRVYPPVSKATVVREATARGLTIWEHAPTSPVAKQYEVLIERLLKDLGGEHGEEG
ncbi:MAG: ParA family protein [Anaerolineae bacterium]|nr:ParA family protein [Anaerolineae bacterium]